MQERDRGLIKYSDEWFLRRYFEYGSVESAMQEEYLPTSVANYHRLIQKYGIVGSAGRHTSFPEVLHFFKEMASSPNTPLEQIYREMPATFKTSLVTLHRIYQHIEANLVRRHAVALFLTHENEESFLVGEEMFSNTRYGKNKGALTVPMSFSKENEKPVESIFRVLQQEVSLNQAISGDFSKKSSFYNEVDESDPKPFFYLTIVDTKVAVYHLTLPENLSFSSFKLTNHRFIESVEIKDIENVRTGITELVAGFNGYLNHTEDTNPIYQQTSLLNQALAPSLAIE